MRNKTLKRVVTFGLTVALALTAVGCGSTDSAEEETTTAEAVAEVTEASEEKEEEPVTEVAENDQLASTEGDASESDAPIEFVYTGDPVTIKVGANITPHSEILEQAKPILAEQGITLEIVQIEDSITPNTGVIEGSLDANYFQHVPYLEQFNEENGSDLVSIGAVHYEPFGVYAGKVKDLKDLPDGAVIAVPNNVTNEARALLLLAQEGILTLKEDAGIEATVADITENPKNIKIVELAGAELPRTLEDVDAAIINCGYATDFGLDPINDPIFKDEIDFNDPAQHPFVNIIAARTEDKENAIYLEVVDAYHSEGVYNAILEVYHNAAIPAFDY